MDYLNTQKDSTTKTQPVVEEPGGIVERAEETGIADHKRPQSETERTKWFNALKNVLPIYISVHLAFFVITCLSVLFIIPDFSWKALPLDMLWQAWNRWDSLHYSYLASHGYTDWWRTVFFPLFPLLERGLALVTHDPFIAGLIIANVAGLAMLVVLYRLVEEDFDAERAYRTVLYLSLFPTAFFFAAAYTESLFLFFCLLSFYYMRQGHWWLAGLLGFFATLTRSTGLLLLLPFCFEYLQQLQFKMKTIRFDVLGGGLILAALGLFMAYCYHRFHSFFPFVRAEHFMWSRDPQSPWFLIKNTIAGIAQSNGFLSFHALRNSIDAGQILLILVLLILSIIGPWRFPRTLWVYTLYAVVLFVVFQLNPVKVNPIKRSFSFTVFSTLYVGSISSLHCVGGPWQISDDSLELPDGFWCRSLCPALAVLTGHWVV